MSHKDNPFTSSTGYQYTLGLFYETTLADKSTVVYTLKDRDHLGYPSLYRLYMECDDPTEYTFATTHLDNWKHWETLCGCSWFKEYVTRWRKELELRTKAAALARIKVLAASKGKEAFQADKFLVAGSWKDKPASRRAGAPTKEEVRQEANRIATTEKDFSDDLLRIKGMN